MLKRDHPKFKGNWILATGASKLECRETHRVKAIRRLRKKSDVEHVAEAYMLKRDHPKFKGNLSSATGDQSRKAAKLTESKHFAVCGRSLMGNK